ncbi:type II toxin-antitoxin system VapC family toxin [Amycolatopsis sp. FDAARGOS 1241]|uniref:type II toxin-antitoxin system VapC family toxin n=1 Tax=Amycolatopsis sp. FDAARGOS 1241 TaxID=2778070 RepID=UPI00195048A2|nr:type II toxin-antitoxin system VapC family toxin [Amycolatopsis sp. FDAARGOS 1241]QRP47694.1 type II toxin-antitoxin system VapC family toxin [Amycolatopsis sp. FDAARGOS 1241]
MAKYVIGPDVAVRLAEERAEVRDEHQLLAPTFIRSHALSLLYARVRRGELPKKAAERQLDFIRGLRIRLLGDRVLQATAWKVAEELGWADTYAAEYVALARLHADALVTLDEELARDVKGLVPVAAFDALI